MSETTSETPARTLLDQERVLETAVALARRAGIESVSMRKLAQELDVGAMTLYHYVPNKERLLDGMVDIVFAEIELPPSGLEWRTAMRRRALSTRAVLNRHRWAVGLMESRAVPGPASLRLHDAVLGCLREGGFPVELAVKAYSVLDAYIYGFMLQEKTVPFETAEESAAVARDQMQHFTATDGGQFAVEFPYLAEVVGGHVAEVGYDFANAFEDGLDLILDALEERRRRGHG
jgi:AcrR family transcriptional regulator